MPNFIYKLLQKNCQQCGTNFEITKSDLEFHKKVSPRFNGKTYDIPPPKFCLECREQRRFSLRNERKLYKHKCGLCKKDIVAIYSPEKPYPVYCPDCFYCDQWEATNFYEEYDFSKSFFEQFYNLLNKVPRLGLVVLHNENSPFCNNVGNSKNCYLLTGSIDCEDCCYGSPYFSKNCIDSLVVRNSNFCYECVDSENLYECNWCQNCENSNNLTLCFDCNNCQDCFGCTGLRHKKYYIFNKPVSKDKYKEFIKNNKANDPKIQKKFQETKLKASHRFMVGKQNENVTGDVMWNSKNIENGFYIKKCEDCKNIYQVVDGKNLREISCGEHGEMLYENTGFYKISNIHFSSHCYDGSYNLYYCDTCSATNNSFGCINLRQKKYCILNKQYTKEEYEKLVPKIIEHMEKNGEWGEFFPTKFSPFTYNETVAQEYFPMTKKDVLAKGWKWKDEEDKTPDVEKIIPAEKLPDDIKEIPDDILNWAIKCEKTGRPFKIQKAELEFYRKQNLPIPHFHPDVRHEMRMAKRNPRKLWERNCAECNTEIETTFAPERPEKVLCEKCYLKEVS